MTLKAFNIHVWDLDLDLDLGLVVVVVVMEKVVVVVMVMVVMVVHLDLDLVVTQDLDLHQDQGPAAGLPDLAHSVLLSGDYVLLKHLTAKLEKAAEFVELQGALDVHAPLLIDLVSVAAS